MLQVRTKDQVADLFTKELNTTKFHKLREKLNMDRRKKFEELVLRESVNDKKHHHLSNSLELSRVLVASDKLHASG